jgi:hypothetical protein
MFGEFGKFRHVRLTASRVAPAAAVATKKKRKGERAPAFVPKRSVAKVESDLYHSRMKTALALCCACAIPAWAQSVPPKVHMGSRVPGVSVQFAGQENKSYKFLIENRTGHNITAFDVLLVPSGVPKKGNRFLCQGRCSESREIDNIDGPAIKAGVTKQVTYDAATVTGGAVVVEAAIFDDGSYGGSERAAAYLVANQIGDQAEFDRIVNAIDTIMAGTGPQITGKGIRIEAELAGIPVDSDPTMMATFYRWFPNVRDCNGRFPAIMRNVSAQVKANVQAKVEALMSQGEPSATALTQWWSATEQYLAGFGCSDCGERMASPSPPVRQQTVSVGCTAQTPGTGSTALSAEMVDDSAMDGDGTDDATDQTAGNDGDSSDMTGQDAADELSMNKEPSEPPAAVASEAHAPAATATAPTVSSPAAEASTTMMTSVSTRCLPMSPRPFGFGAFAHAVGAAQEDAHPVDARPVTDEQLYPRYFRYVKQWDKCFSEGIWPESKVEEYPDPYPEGMNENQRQVVTIVAYDWEQSRQDSDSEPKMPAVVPGAGPGIASQRFAGETTWAQMQKVMQQRQLRAEETEERVKLVESRVSSLRLALGKNSFREFDDYVHALYQTIPGRLLREPLPETAMYNRYFHLISSLDKLAANGGDDGKEAAKARTEEQKACQLSDKEEGILQQVADDYEREFEEFRPRIGISSGSDLGRPTAAGVRPPEAGRFPQGRGRIVAAHIEQLQSSLGKGSFEKIELRMHELYDSDGPRRIVPIEAPETEIKAGEVSGVER